MLYPSLVGQNFCAYHRLCLFGEAIRPHTCLKMVHASSTVEMPSALASSWLRISSRIHSSSGAWPALTLADTDFDARGAAAVLFTNEESKHLTTSGYFENPSHYLHYTLLFQINRHIAPKAVYLMDRKIWPSPVSFSDSFC